MKIGDARRAQGKAGKALLIYRHALKRMRALVERDPQNSDWQRLTAVILTKIGDVYDAENDKALALTMYQESTMIRRALAERDRENHLWQMELYKSCVDVGFILHALGRVDEEREMKREVISILRREDARGRLDARLRDSLVRSDGPSGG